MMMQGKSYLLVLVGLLCAATARGFVVPIAVQQVQLQQSGGRWSHLVLHLSSGSVPVEVGDSSYITAMGSRSTHHPKDNFVQSLAKDYTRWTHDHYLAMAFLQAAVLASVADISTQTLEGATLVGTTMDWGHVAAMAIVASTMSGVMNAICLRQLEQAFPGNQTKHVAAKTLIHAIIIASIINSAYLVGVPLLADHVFDTDSLAHFLTQMPSQDWWAILQGNWKWEEFVILTKLEVAMFIPYNTLAFQFVPPNLRPLTHAAISATFNIAVSAVTLGYFHTWCDRGMDLVSKLQ